MLADPCTSLQTLRPVAGWRRVGCARGGGGGEASACRLPPAASFKPPLSACPCLRLLRRLASKLSRRQPVFFPPSISPCLLRSFLTPFLTRPLQPSFLSPPSIHPQSWFDDRVECRNALSKLSYLTGIKDLDRNALPWTRYPEERDVLILEGKVTDVSVGDM